MTQLGFYPPLCLHRLVSYPSSLDCQPPRLPSPGGFHVSKVKQLTACRPPACTCPLKMYICFLQTPWCACTTMSVLAGSPMLPHTPTQAQKSPDSRACLNMRPQPRNPLYTLLPLLPLQLISCPGSLPLQLPQCTFAWLHFLPAWARR